MEEDTNARLQGEEDEICEEETQEVEDWFLWLKRQKKEKERDTN